MRGGNVAAVALATVCGVATAYTTFQPALEQQKEEREGTFRDNHKSPEDQERIISKAISNDFEEAKKELKKLDDGGFAWGIRKWFRGQESQPDAQSQSTNNATSSAGAGK